jgi:hypothetical protein
VSYPVDHFSEAAKAHTNLTMMHAVIALCESGCLYGPVPAAKRIIQEARAEAQRQLRLYDKHKAAALQAPKTRHA